MDLPDDLELPLASGAPWWYWLGGRPAIDFVNTHRERWRRNVETLVTPADLSLWLRQAKLLDEPAAATGGQLRGARRLRDAINLGIEATVEGAATPSRATEEINRWLAHVAFPQRLHAGNDGVAVLLETPPADAVRSALSQIALDAAILLSTDQRDRLRICASESCSALLRRLARRHPALVLDDRLWQHGQSQTPPSPTIKPRLIRQLVSSWRSVPAAPRPRRRRPGRLPR